MGDRLYRRRCADGDCGKPRQVGSEGAKPKRADHDANQDKAKHRTHMQAVEEWDDYAGSAKDNERLLIGREVKRGGFHPTSLTGPTNFLVRNCAACSVCPLSPSYCSH